MDFARIFEFIGNHPILILAFVGTLGVLFASEIIRRMNGMKSVGPVQATQLSNRENAVFLDTREDREYSDGHIPEAIHIPLKQLPERVAELNKYKEHPIIAYDRSGNRSSGAGSVLKKHGFESVYNLGGGIAAWQSASLPVSKK
ncbi:MAG: rhodanese-like domain-containing protein [Gammaproteobacteria bacterium]|nr:MAG: rhodanese-like domain-containing protein [Gammaproteobacteria bacterium]